MRKTILIYVLTFSFVLPVTAQSFFRGLMRVDNCVMSEKDDSLQVNFTVRVDREAARWFMGALFTPVVLDGDPSEPDIHFVEMPNIMLLGKNKYRAYERSIAMLGRSKREEFKRAAATIRISPETDTLIHYKYTLPYDRWMDAARLTFYLETFSFRNERNLFALMADGGVQLAPRIPYEIQPQVNFYMPAAEEKLRTKQVSAYLDFQLNKTDILPGFRRNPRELAKIFEVIDEVQQVEGITPTGLFIAGYASIEGSYDHNLRLARGRAFALKNYITSNFSLPLGDDQIKVSWVPEDWDGLRAGVETSDLAQKEQLLSIIDNTPVVNERERALTRLAGGDPFRTILREILPQGRRVEFRIDYSVREFTIRETELLMNGKMHLLNQLELYRLAQSYGEGAEPYNELMMEIIPRHYPDSPTAAVNAAAVMIRNGRYAAARRLLEKFASHPQVWNNLGIACLYEGDMDHAETLLKKAADAGIPEARHNLGEWQKKRDEHTRSEGFNK